MNCTRCGDLIADDARYCGKCGAAKSMAPGFVSPVNGPNRISAALFAILLGGLGIHKFYLHKDFQGFLCLLFCWTFIPAIIGLVEGVTYITMDDRAFAAKFA